MSLKIWYKRIPQNKESLFQFYFRETKKKGNTPHHLTLTEKKNKRRDSETFCGSVAFYASCNINENVIDFRLRYNNICHLKKNVCDLQKF